MKYKSLVHQQLVQYLDAVQATGLISRYEVAARIKGPGFKIVFFPGDGFFEDYDEFYLRPSNQANVSRLDARSPQSAQPLQLVAYFHQLLGHKQDTFADKEKVRASELLRTYSADEVRDLINFAVEKMKAAHHNPDFFGNVVNYVPAWSAHQTDRKQTAQRLAAAAGCPICHGRGVVVVTTSDGSEVARQCNHGQAVDKNDLPAVH
jgi:hypothetical protein